MAIEPAGKLDGSTVLEFSHLRETFLEHSDRSTTSTNAVPATTVAIVGAGRGGTALLEVLNQIRSDYAVDWPLPTYGSGVR